VRVTEVVVHFESVGVEVPPPAPPLPPPKLLVDAVLGEGVEERVAEKLLKLDEARGVAESDGDCVAVVQPVGLGEGWPLTVAELVLVPTELPVAEAEKVTVGVAVSLQVRVTCGELLVRKETPELGLLIEETEAAALAVPRAVALPLADPVPVSVPKILALAPARVGEPVLVPLTVAVAETVLEVLAVEEGVRVAVAWAELVAAGVTVAVPVALLQLLGLRLVDGDCVKLRKAEAVSSPEDVEEEEAVAHWQPVGVNVADELELCVFARLEV